MLEGLKLKDQEYHPGEDYEFYGIRVSCTATFASEFGESYMTLIKESLQLISEKYPDRKWDYLQVFSYKDNEFYAISDCQKGDRDGIVVFMMPSDY